TCALPISKLAYTVVFVAMTVAATGYVLLNYSSVATRAGAYNAWDIAFGLMMLLVVFEGARRGTGWPIVIVAAAFFIYAFVGPYLPAIIAHRGFPLARRSEERRVGKEWRSRGSR